MASGANDALALAAAYRTQQLAVRAAVVRDAIALWPVLDKANVGGTSPDWLRLLRALVQRWWTVSATLALDFYPKARAGVAGAPRLTLPPAPSDEVILRNLLYTGPGEIKRAAARGLTPVQADRSAVASSAQSAARLALQGGRDTIDLAIERDPEARGWMRVTDGNPCAFCAMLASRGPVYKTAASAGADPRDLYGDAAPVSHWHDSCGCTVVPVFTTKPAITREAKHFDALWASSTAGLSGNDARIAFRRAVEGRGADVPTTRQPKDRQGRAVLTRDQIEFQIATLVKQQAANGSAGSQVARDFHERRLRELRQMLASLG